MTDEKPRLIAPWQTAGLWPWSWNVRPLLGRSLNQVLDERLTGIFAGTGAGLQDDGCSDLVGRHHDGLHLLQVVDVESWNAVAVDGCMVQQLAH
jgi:hypothetical protein